MTRTLSQKGIEKAAAKIYDKGITAATLGNCQVIAGLAIAAYLDEVEREAPASDPAPAGWRHKKRGTTYDATHDYELQTSRPLVEGDVVRGYICRETGKPWARPVDEFHDGRFERIPAAPEPPVSEPKPMIYLLDELNGIVIGGKKHGWIVWLNRNENWQTVKKARVRDPMENVPDIFKPLPAAPKGRDE